MSRNKRAPSSLQKYVVCVLDRTKEAVREEFHYFANQKEAKEWARTKTGKKKLFRISYDFYQEL